MNPYRENKFHTWIIKFMLLLAAIILLFFFVFDYESKSGDTMPVLILIIILVTACIAGLILLIRHLLGRGDTEHTKMTLLAAGFMGALIIIFAAADDIISPEASKTSLFIGLILVFFWGAWSLYMVEQQRRQKDYRNSHFIFDISKSYAVSCTHPDHPLSAALLNISEFMDAYNMCEEDFKSKIVLHGIELAIQEYINEHPEPLVYHSGHSFDE